MEPILKLLKQFDSMTIPAEKFVEQYVVLADKIRDEQWAALNAKPMLKTAFDQLTNDRLSGKITPEEFLTTSNKIFSQITDVSVPLGTKMADSIAELYTIVDAFNADPERESYQIDEVALREAVKKVLKELY